DQQRLAVRSLHHAGAGAAPDVNQPEPVAPVRRVALRALEVARHGVTSACLSELRLESTFGDLAGRFGRQYAVKGSTPDTRRASVVGPRSDQHRAAVTHISCDVVEIDERQHSLPGVAVEDDQLEFTDLLLEQLARRKCDQRKLVDGRAVLFFRGAQNGEMDEVDGSIRLEKIPPGALTGVRLSGHQQYAQLVAHAV